MTLDSNSSGAIKVTITGNDRGFPKAVRAAIKEIEKLDLVLKASNRGTKKAAKTRFKITNKTEVTTKLNRVKGRVRNSLAFSVYKAGIRIMDDSIDLVPVDTSRLQKTAYVSRPSGKDMKVKIGYDTPYAFWQHMHHRDKSRYLSRPTYAYSGVASKNARSDFMEAFKARSSAAFVASRYNTSPMDPGRRWQKNVKKMRQYNPSYGRRSR